MLRSAGQFLCSGPPPLLLCNTRAMKSICGTIRLDTKLLSYFAAVGFAISLTAAAVADVTHQPLSAPGVAPACLKNNEAFFRARLAGAINAELNWNGAGVECTGDVRPGKGLRLKFSSNRREPALVIVLGIADVREGEPGHALPVNVTIIREGAGEFFGTQGTDKCTIDELRQQLLTPVARRVRSYKITARGFCTEPARAVRGTGVVLMNRFDFAGRVDSDAAADSTQQTPIEKQVQLQPNEHALALLGAFAAEP